MTEWLPPYELFALRYATHPAMRRDHFIGGDPHDLPMPMDRFGAALASSFIFHTTFFGSPSFADDRQWPDRPLRLIVPLPAGSPADAVARLIGSQLSRSDPDGNTLASRRQRRW